MVISFTCNPQKYRISSPALRLSPLVNRGSASLNTKYAIFHNLMYKNTRLELSSFFQVGATSYQFWESHLIFVNILACLQFGTQTMNPVFCTHVL